MNEDFQEADEFCPHCDNHFVIEAKTIENTGKIVLEFKMEKGHENKMSKDDREKDRARVLQPDLAWGSDDDSDEDFKMPPGFQNLAKMK